MSKLSRFAGLVGFGAKKAEDDKDKPEAGAAAAEKPKREDYDSDQEYEDALKEWEDAQGDDSEAKKAEDKKDEDEKAKAKAAGIAEGVTAERARWGAVLGSAEAAGKVVAACDLLADSDMTAADITKVLGKLGAVSPRSTIAARHPVPTPAPAAGGDHSDDTAKAGAKGFAARVTAAVDKAGGLRLTHAPAAAKKTA